MGWFRFGDLVLGGWCVGSACLTVVVWFCLVILFVWGVCGLVCCWLCV